MTDSSETNQQPLPPTTRERMEDADGPIWELDVAEVPSDAKSGPDDPAASAPPSVVQIVEALLFVGGGPLTLERAVVAIRGLTDEQFTEAMETLNRLYRSQGRPYAIRMQEHGYVVVLRPRFGPVVDRIYGQAKEARLSPAAIDVLSLVAYRQPVTKLEVDSIRGYESGILLRQLVRRGLIAIAQRGEAGRREVTYGTTARFLELFDLTSLDDLPQTQELQKL